MKKALTLFAGLAMASSVTFGQLPSGSIAPSCDLYDINSVNWDFDSLCNLNKTIFISVPATWDMNAWNYHQSGELNQFNALHGPSGTTDQMCHVFMVEGDGTTGTAELNGSGNTQGNWIMGTNYHIIDPPPGLAPRQIDWWMNLYNVPGFTTVYMICPDHKIYYVGQQNVAGLENWMNTCPYNLDILPLTSPTVYCTSTAPLSFMLKNNNLSAPLTTCTVSCQIDAAASNIYVWNGNIPAGATALISIPPQTLSTGNHTMTIVTSLPNGGTDENNNNDTARYNFEIVTASPVFPYSEQFTATGFPYANYGLENPDDSITWSHDTTSGGRLVLRCYDYGTRGAQDAFTLPPISLTTTTNAMLNFKVAYARYNWWYSDTLGIVVSDDCGANWNMIWTKGGSLLATAPDDTMSFVPGPSDWSNESASLNAYIGSNQLLIKFIGTVGFGNNMYVDDIDITTTTANSDPNHGMTYRLFPNPASGEVTLAFNLSGDANVTVNVYSMVGELISSTLQGKMSTGEQQVLVSTENLSTGMYIVELVTGESRTRNTLSVFH